MDGNGWEDAGSQKNPGMQLDSLDTVMAIYQLSECTAQGGG